MHVFQFPTLRLVEAVDPGRYLAAVKTWLTEREAEHHMLLNLTERLAADFLRSGERGARCFALMDGARIQAAMIVRGDTLYSTWGSPEMLDAVVKGLIKLQVNVRSIHGPGHVAFFMAKAWAAQSGGDITLDRADRLYQLARVIHKPPAEGRLAVAGAAELPVAMDWMRDCMAEGRAGLEDAEGLARRLVEGGHLYMWMHPGPVAMATFVDPTPNGGSIRHVYVPRAMRRRGFGKAVLAALTAKMLGSGKKYCFVLADPADYNVDRMLQKVGARTICEFAQWRVTEAATPA